jgi:hypothetical protein
MQVKARAQMWVEGPIALEHCSLSKTAHENWKNHAQAPQATDREVASSSA